MLLALLSGLAVLLHVGIELFAGYGIFRDEFYYIACSKRLAFGYVDHPPFSIWVLFLWRQLAGESQFAIRLLPALVSGAAVWMSGSLARRMGGGRTAVVFASLLFILSPICLAFASIWSMNILDLLFWLVAARIALDALEEGKPRQWLLLGVVLGLGCMNKISMVWFGLGLASVLIGSGARRQLRTPWPWAAVGIALLIFLPFALWNASHDFAHLEFIRNASMDKYGGITRADFLFSAILIHNPFAIVAVLGGLYWTLVGAGQRFRALGVIWLVTFIILLVNGHSKPEYLTAATTLMFVAGGVWIEQWSGKRANVFRVAFTAVILVSGILLAPLAAPVLPVESFIAYNNAIAPPVKNSEGHAMGELPQFFADMHGWESMAATVSKVYSSLPDEQRTSAVVLAHNYGEAAALEYYSDRHPLPRVISMHNNYWLWGYPSGIETVIVIGGSQDDHSTACKSVVAAATHRHRYAMRYESDLTIWICSGFRVSISEIWRSEKHYI